MVQSLSCPPPLSFQTQYSRLSNHPSFAWTLITNPGSLSLSLPSLLSPSLFPPSSFSLFLLSLSLGQSILSCIQFSYALICTCIVLHSSSGDLPCLQELRHLTSAITMGPSLQAWKYTFLMLIATQCYR